TVADCDLIACRGDGVGGGQRGGRAGAWNCREHGARGVIIPSNLCSNTMVALLDPAASSELAGASLSFKARDRSASHDVDSVWKQMCATTTLLIFDKAGCTVSIPSTDAYHITLNLPTC